jgi:energy-coupling factor transport system permease protein
MREMTMGRYFPGDSIIHRSDPRTKIILAMIFMVVVFLVDSFPAILLLLLAVIFVAGLAGKSLQYTLRSLRPVLFLSLFAVAVNLFGVSGTPVTEHGILRHISGEGICMASKMVLRLLILASCASLLTFTTSPLALTDALERLMKHFNKLRVPVHEIAMMITISMRFIPTILEEADRITKAQASRRPDRTGGSSLQRARNCIPVILPLMVGAFRRGDELATAMEARCYRGNIPRTRMRRHEFSSADLTSASVMLVFLTALLIVEYARF